MNDKLDVCIKIYDERDRAIRDLASKQYSTEERMVLNSRQSQMLKSANKETKGTLIYYERYKHGVGKPKSSKVAKKRLLVDQKIFIDEDDTYKGYAMNEFYLYRW